MACASAVTLSYRATVTAGEEMASPRVHFPETLPTAAKFSGEVSLNECVELVRAFKQTSWLSRPFIAKLARLEKPGGRHRLEGSWGLVALAMVASRQGDIQPFYSHATMELWRECGFSVRPHYSTAYARLTELEKANDVIAETIHTMIRHYRRHEPRIARHVRIDGTEAETHSRFIHDCQDDEYCAYRDGTKAEADARAAAAAAAAAEAATTTQAATDVEAAAAAEQQADAATGNETETEAAAAAAAAPDGDIIVKRATTD